MVWTVDSVVSVTNGYKALFGSVWGRGTVSVYWKLRWPPVLDRFGIDRVLMRLGPSTNFLQRSQRFTGASAAEGHSIIPISVVQYKTLRIQRPGKQDKF